MKRVALQVEHKYKNRLSGVHLIDANRRIATIGSSRHADLHLLGDDVSGLHGAFEYENDRWVLSDWASESGTWIHKHPIVEAEIEGATVIHIGAHQLKATPHVLDRDLFRKPLESTEGAETYHQVVVMRNGLVVRTHLLPQNSPFVFEMRQAGQTQNFAPPKARHMVVHATPELTLDSAATRGLGPWRLKSRRKRRSRARSNPVCTARSFPRSSFFSWSSLGLLLAPEQSRRTK